MEVVEKKTWYANKAKGKQIGILEPNVLTFTFSTYQKESFLETTSFPHSFLSL